MLRQTISLSASADILETLDAFVDSCPGASRHLVHELALREGLDILTADQVRTRIRSRCARAGRTRAALHAHAPTASAVEDQPLAEPVGGSRG